jgi:hypothetical protein
MEQVSSCANTVLTKKGQMIPMYRFSRSLILTLLVAGAVFLATPPPADAAFQLRLSDDGGTTFTTITDGGAGDSSSMAGVIVFNGAIGNWIVNVTTGISKPVFPNTPSLAKMDLNSTNVHANSSGTLTIELTDTGFSLVPSPFNYILNNQFGGTISGGTVTAQSFIGVTEFDTSTFSSPVLGPLGPGAFAASSSSTFAGSSPFSITQRLNLTVGAGVTNFSGDFETTVVTPAPPSLLLAGLGLPFLGLAYWYKRKPALVAA